VHYLEIHDHSYVGFNFGIFFKTLDISVFVWYSTSTLLSLLLILFQLLIVIDKFTIQVSSGVERLNVTFFFLPQKSPFSITLQLVNFDVCSGDNGDEYLCILYYLFAGHNFMIWTVKWKKEEHELLCNCFLLFSYFLFWLITNVCGLHVFIDYTWGVLVLIVRLIHLLFANLTTLITGLYCQC
jgi:hypothetical protein